MHLKMYAVYDRAVGLFLQPIFMRSEGEAVRALRHVAKDHMFRTNPADYALFYVGTFEEEKAVFEIEVPPRHVVDLVTLMEE